MPDIELDHFGQLCDCFGRQIIEAMAGMDFEAEPMCMTCASTQSRKFGACKLSLVLNERITPGAGMEFDYWRIECCCGINLSQVRRDEQRHADTGSSQF